MKVSYVFPLIKEDINAEKFLSQFMNTNFFMTHKDFEMFLVVKSTDEKNIEYLKTLSKLKENFKVIILNKKFTYGKAFSICLKYIEGDLALLGDTGIDNNHVIFEDLYQEHLDGAKVVQVKKDYNWFVNFFVGFAAILYNFFIKMFAANSDTLNISSLGLIDKLVLDIMKEIPEKANFLRNAMYLEGIDMRSYFIDPKTKTYNNSFTVNTISLIMAICNIFISVAVTIAIIFCNVYIVNVNIIALNIILIFVLLISFSSILIAICKHVIDVRIDNLKSDVIILEEINTIIEKPLPQKDITAKKTQTKVGATKNKVATKKVANKKSPGNKKTVSKNKTTKSK